MKKFFVIVVITLSVITFRASADEGMWIPLLIEKYNIDDMQAKGFKLTAEDIYSINNACLIDAVVLFGRGCTGELISDQGLLLTNHHCGYGAIQKHSSVELDYLTDGFWAMNNEQELPNPDLTVKFLKRIADVTDIVLADIGENLLENERAYSIEENIKKIENNISGGEYINSIESFFYGNQYYLFVYEEFKDVRLVGAPPSAIGKFGGDTDNWMWPRHTGDFSVFRIYADKDNSPAEYAIDNVPYKPKKYLSVSLKGINEGDFTLVLGYPGSTKEYIISDAIKQIKEIRNPKCIELRNKRLEIMNKYMDTNDTIRIKYAGKNARVSNSWKRWKGEIVGLERLNAIETKSKLEKKFNKWATGNEYANVIPELESIYERMEKYTIAYDYYKESIMAIEIIRFAEKFKELIEIASFSEIDSLTLEIKIQELEKQSEAFYKDYVEFIDKEIFYELLPMYFNNVAPEFHPEIIDVGFEGDYMKFIESLFINSIFTQEDEIDKILISGSAESIQQLVNDPVYKFLDRFGKVYSEKILPYYDSLNAQTNILYRKYIKGLSKMQNDNILYPDANLTMRVSYGEIKGSQPKDGVKYVYYTTLDGVMEKDNPDIYDYDVPDKLKELFESKDYGIYEVNGTVPVCFIATNHTTGGNSGSPVLDAEGNLIGINFDRVWEGIMSDMVFDPEQSRNISLDIRYILFIIDKYAGAKYLIDEMNIIK
ncbi:MAG: S46 family peptidase [Bacteroidales bacterium]|nr:S46 family peptidase [Bacteroidales bacterium]